MIRISIPYVYKLYEALLPLASIKQGDTVGDHLFAIYNADSLLDQFINQSLWGTSLRVCRKPGNDLLTLIRSLCGEPLDVASPFEYWRVVGMQQQLSSFKAIMEAELLITASYLVTPRRGYDIATLIEAAEEIFPEELISKVPDTRFDLREAGKCLAFDLGTAAGFHLLRALETVIRKYWSVVMDGAPLPAARNLGVYIMEMEKAKRGKPKVLSALRQIKDHHRNELMHPEERLDLDQAISIMGITQSAIVAMLKEIPEPPSAPVQTLSEATGEMLLPGGDIEPE